jgi:hypothetical protein
MMPPVQHKAVIGIDELEDSFERCGTFMDKELKAKLVSYAGPVRRTAQTMAVAEIPKIGLLWSRMRTGATQKMVYVAPVQRGTRVPSRRRPKLAPKLMNEAMVPALNIHREEIVGKVDGLLARMEREYERNG